MHLKLYKISGIDVQKRMWEAISKFDQRNLPFRELKELQTGEIKFKNVLVLEAPIDIVLKTLV